MLEMLNRFSRPKSFTEQPESCPICFNNFPRDEQSECLKLKCGHIFHEACVQGWIQEKGKCPTCRGYSTLRVKKSLISVISEIKGTVEIVFNAGVNLVTYEILPAFGASLVLITASRAFQGLSLIPTSEEMLEAVEKAYQRNLSIGLDFRPPVYVGYKAAIISILLIPVGISAVTAIYLFAKHYFTEIIAMKDSAERINYIPPPPPPPLPIE